MCINSEMLSILIFLIPDALMLLRGWQCYNQINFPNIQVLLAGAIKYNRVRKTRDFDGRVRDVPDFLEVARTMIKAFRTGDLGRTLLDIDLLHRTEEKTRQLA
jgi:hypothetical protein